MTDDSSPPPVAGNGNADVSPSHTAPPADEPELIGWSRWPFGCLLGFVVTAFAIPFLGWLVGSLLGGAALTLVVFAPLSKPTPETPKGRDGPAKDLLQKAQDNPGPVERAFHFSLVTVLGALIFLGLMIAGLLLLLSGVNAD